MKFWSALLLFFAIALPSMTFAQSTPVSTIRLAHPVLLPGQAQIVTVTARDLKGHPLPGARARAQVVIGTRVRSYTLHATNRAGITTMALHPAAARVRTHVTVRISITNGFISIPLSTGFDLLPTGSSATPTGTPSAGRSPTATPKPTHTARTPTATAAPTTTATPVGTTVVVVPRAVPDTVVAPTPAWVVAFVHDGSGTGLAGVPVSVIAAFASGTVTAVGATDPGGVASVMVPTDSIRSTQTVTIQVTAGTGSHAISASTTLTVAMPQPTAPAVPTPAPTSTATPVPPSGLPPTPTSVPTSGPIPTDTPLPLPTSTPAPTPTSTPIPNCPGDMQGCMQAELSILNATRAQYGVGPLALNQTQSLGTASCVGSIGHSQAMQQSGFIWHINASYPAASFPNDICVGASTFGENVGETATGNELNDLHTLNTIMMSEPHDTYTCSVSNDHACNILNSGFRQVGVGIVYVNGNTWLTTDFSG